MEPVNDTPKNDITRLTQYSRGAGCGCKIAPALLQEMLTTTEIQPADKRLLVGNGSNDDAAVYDIGNGMAVISTTDFFMPIVDDAVDFGRIAAANAISDIYAMGGKPLMAVAILGWPVEKLPASLARQVLEGARNICGQAGIALAGGHSIDSVEPMFGLAVTGTIEIKDLKQNNTARAGDLVFITKPIGSGILSTAQKRGILKPHHLEVMIRQMTSLNNIGEKLGKMSEVTAMTDVTGFGILGHLVEMSEGAGIGAEIYYSRLPVTDGAREYLSQKAIPDATFRNWNSYSSQVEFEKGVNVMEAFSLLPDPQTNGGLLFSVDENGVSAVQELLAAEGYTNFLQPIGRFITPPVKRIQVKI